MAKLATFLHCEEKIVYLPLTVATLVYIQPRVKKTTLILILAASLEACTRFELQQRTGQQLINLFKPAEKSTNLITILTKMGWLIMSHLSGSVLLAFLCLTMKPFPVAEDLTNTTVESITAEIKR